MSNNKEIIAITVVFLTISIGLLGYMVGINNMAGATVLTGSVISKLPIQTAVSAQETEWAPIVDETIEIGPLKMFKSFGKVGGEILSTKYSVKSDKKIEIYWVESGHDCDNLNKGSTYHNYPNCQPATKGAYEYSSRECKLPSDSGLCILNKGLESAKVEISVEKKI